MKIVVVRILKRQFQLILLLMSLSLSACHEEESMPILQPKEVRACLNIVPSLEYETLPLSRVATQENGLYAINVYWRKDATNAFQPYASGLFDDLSNVCIGLIEGYIYRFDCSFMRSNELPYHENEKYGLPFSISAKGNVDAEVINRLKISLNPFNENEHFHQHIYKGAVQISADSVSVRPKGVHRFFGSTTCNDLKDKSVPRTEQSEVSVEIEMKRAYYTLQFSAEELSEGDSVKICIDGTDEFYIDSKSGKSSDERLLSIQSIANPWNGAINEEEKLTLSVSLRCKDDEVWTDIIVGQSVTVKRNRRNKIKIVNIDRHYNGNASVSFEGGGSDQEPEEEENLEIG